MVLAEVACLRLCASASSDGALVGLDARHPEREAFARQDLADMGRVLDPETELYIPQEREAAPELLSVVSELGLPCIHHSGRFLMSCITTARRCRGLQFTTRLNLYPALTTSLLGATCIQPLTEADATPAFTTLTRPIVLASGR